MRKLIKKFFNVYNLYGGLELDFDELDLDDDIDNQSKFFGVILLVRMIEFLYILLFNYDFINSLVC